MACLVTSSCCPTPRLHSLRSLSLHNNLLTYLPREILSLVHLQELSLRGNPLVVRFVKEMTYDPPSLLELAGRTIKSRNIPYHPHELPANLLRYLDLASKCPNPKCAGKTLLLSQSLHVAWCASVNRVGLSQILRCHFTLSVKKKKWEFLPSGQTQPPWWSTSTLCNFDCVTLKKVLLPLQESRHTCHRHPLAAVKVSKVPPVLKSMLKSPG